MSCDSEITMTKITGGHLRFVCMCVCREWGRMWPSQRRRWQGFSLQRQARAQHRLKHGRNQRASGDRQHTGVFHMHVCKLVCRVVEEGPVLFFTSDLRTTSLGSWTLYFPVKFKTFIRRGEQRWSSVDLHRRWGNIQAPFMKLFHFPQLQGRFWSSEGLLVEYLPFCGDLTDSSATTPQGRSVLSCYPSGISTD